VRQPRAVEVALVDDENLRLVTEPPEGLRVKNAVAVLLEEGPVSGMLLRIFVPDAVVATNRERGQTRLPARADFVFHACLQATFYRKEEGK
jgi:hypothetical protein